MHSDQFSPSCYLFLYCLMKHPWLICQVCDGTSWLPSTTLMVERDLKFSTTLSASDLWRHPEKNSVRYFVLSWWRMEILLVRLQQKDFCCSWRLDNYDLIWNTIKSVCLRCVHHIWSKSRFWLPSQQTWAQYSRCKNVNRQHQLEDSL